MSPLLRNFLILSIYKFFEFKLLFKCIIITAIDLFLKKFYDIIEAEITNTDTDTNRLTPILKI